MFILIISFIFLIFNYEFLDEDRYIIESKLPIKELSSLLNSYGFRLLNMVNNIKNSYIITPKNNINKRDFVPVLISNKNIEWIFKEKWRKRQLRQVSDKKFTEETSDKDIFQIKDSHFYQQWYLLHNGNRDTKMSMDINILPVWNKGFDGTGVTIGILDDGLDYKNFDIYPNYDKKNSYDYIDNDYDPIPINKNSSHGTRCASIAAGASNKFCGIGVAYNASIAGIRMLNKKTTDSIESNALSHRINQIDIYSCNWGPRDDGMRFGRPGVLATKALKNGIKNGRKNKGSIYVWSSGNGGLSGDDCSADGYVTNLATIVIGSITAFGNLSPFSEYCPSVMAVTFSSDSSDNNTFPIINSDSNNKCLTSLKGTSSSASIATGLIALMLQANPLITWRDVQYIIVESSQIVNPSDTQWNKNGAGKWYNSKYGFGKLDALAMVDTAYRWKNVDKVQKKCKISKSEIEKSKIYKGGMLLSNMNTTICSSKNKSISQLEQVQLSVTVEHECRGRLSIILISPSGTKSHILKPRSKDNSTKGLQDWIFKSVQFWGENPTGQWSLILVDDLSNDPCDAVNSTKKLADAIYNNETIYKDLNPKLEQIKKLLDSNATIGNETFTNQTNYNGDKILEIKKQLEDLKHQVLNKNEVVHKEENISLKKKFKSKRIKNGVYERILLEKIKLNPKKKKNKSKIKNEEEEVSMRDEDEVTKRSRVIKMNKGKLLSWSLYLYGI